MKIFVSCFIFLCFIFSIPCEGLDYEKGQIAVSFKSGTSEEDAIRFMKGVNLKIIGAYNFEIIGLNFIIEKNLRSYMREFKNASSVKYVSEGETMELAGKTGKVVRIKFVKGTTLKEINKLKDKYMRKEEIVGWRYSKKEPPLMIASVPNGKERAWMDSINKLSQSNIVSQAKLICYDIPY